MKKLNVVLTIVVIMVLSGCGSDDKYSGNYGGVSGANAAGTTKSSSIYTNGEEDQELKDTLLIDLLGNPKSTDTDTDTDTTKNTTPTTVTTSSDTFKTKNAGYSAGTNSLPVCFNTEETILEYNAIPKFTCEWYCGIYDGDGPIHVKLTFLKENSIWTLTDEDLSTSSSQCHN